MRRPPDRSREPDREPEPRLPSESEAEERLRQFLERHPRFFLWLGIGLGAVIVAALVAVKVFG